MKTEESTKQTYEAPQLEVVEMVAEGVIAVNSTPTDYEEDDEWV